MILSPDYKRLKRINFTGDTFTLPMVRSSIIRTMQGYSYHQNTANLWRLKNQPQNRGNDNQKTNRMPTVYNRAFWSFLHLIIEMIPFLVYYSYERKYHNVASMNIPGYQCSNVYIDVEKGASMNKDIQ